MEIVDVELSVNPRIKIALVNRKHNCRGQELIITIHSLEQEPSFYEILFDNTKLISFCKSIQ